jgi:hypothetical protein
MEKLKVCFTLPEVAKRITHPFRALVVVNGAVPKVAPASILSVFAIVNAALVGLNDTTVGVFKGAASEITQLPEIPGVRTVGEQDNVQGLVTAGGTRETVTAEIDEPRAAVMTALCAVAMTAVEALKEVATALGGTVTAAGTLSRVGRLLERDTDTPPAGAALDRVTVHAVLALGLRLAAAHLRPERVGVATGATSEIVAAADEVFRAAVTVADWLDPGVPAAAVKVADAALDGTLTEAGTVSRVGALLESATTVMAVADFDRVTVHVVLALAARLAGAHCREETFSGDTSESVSCVDVPFSVAVTVAG